MPSEPLICGDVYKMNFDPGTVDVCISSFVKFLFYGFMLFVYLCLLLILLATQSCF